jgi:hypothetical protein
MYVDDGKKSDCGKPNTSLVSVVYLWAQHKIKHGDMGYP